MNVFIDDTPKDIEELQISFNAKNYKKVKEVCHKLKGLFKSYNMLELTQLTVELENNAKQENLGEGSIKLLNQILSNYEILKSEMIILRDDYKKSEK
ncbi:MAG TPA: Hpt domain-containing protein [Leptospiraceae bacterium]|nr:Hpt domain-containing protein [Leptospiraceae bacterium]